ncbi:hypothetical protein FOVG_19067 [Fusarium oxysporum f. sp. pisi HDV247]|uniref:Uncharacterized protein n=1 Tax=Fusarium oxysporum f. sp. pisi HDV247 TaxID=1080344 RepID=W9NHI3_FUSOX|nr:hypothetical protein FOVG_19067 [Fusarium oxysporum f. sp. pisi HDV247]
MEKVWFKLHQTDYPPPPEDTILLGDGDDSTAPICLGHFVSDLKHLNFPLNSGSILPFHRRMIVYRNTVLNFSWNDGKTSAPGTNLAASAPILAAAGIIAKASLQVAFMRTTENHEAYDRLDTYVVQPSETYIEECLEQDKLKAYVKGKASWSMFMITGIKVARAGKRETRREKTVGTDIGPQLDVPSLVTLTATANVHLANSQRSYGEYPGDFIWAVRLAKVHKGFLMRDWSVAAYTHRATFADDENDLDVASVLRDEGLEDFQIIDDGELDEALVLDKRVLY